MTNQNIKLLCQYNPNNGQLEIIKSQNFDSLNSNSKYTIEDAVGDIIGFSIDMRSHAAAVMSVSVNGSFSVPNGIAFDNIEAPYLSPAFSGGGGQYRVNFGDRPFAYAPIDEHYISVHAFHKQKQEE